MKDKGILALLGSNIRQKRGFLGISQEELAFRCGLHRTYIGGVERGERNLSIINLVRIAIALNTDPSELIKNLQNSTS